MIVLAEVLEALPHLLGGRDDALGGQGLDLGLQDAVNLGWKLLSWRRSTATSWRSTRISAFFDVELRANNPSQPTSCRKTR